MFVLLSVDSTAPKLLQPLFEKCNVQFFDRTIEVKIYASGYPGLDDQTKRELIDRLQEFSSLELLNLCNANFTKEEVEELKQEMPDCLVAGPPR